MTQYNLGNALQELGEREGNPVRLEAAVEAYKLALEVYTQEDLDWAKTQNQSGQRASGTGGARW